MNKNIANTTNDTTTKGGKAMKKEQRLNTIKRMITNNTPATEAADWIEANYFGHPRLSYEDDFVLATKGMDPHSIYDFCDRLKAEFESRKGTEIQENLDATSLDLYAEKVAKLTGGEIKKVEKTNGIIKTGITFPGGRVAPVYYLDEAFAEGRSPEEQAAEIMKHRQTITSDVPDLEDFSVAKPMLRARLYNKKTKVEVFESAAEYGFDDLIIVPVIDGIKVAGVMRGSAKLSQSMLESWGITTHEAIEIAMANSKYVICTLAEKLANLMGMPVPADAAPPLFVVSNGDYMYGAIGGILAQRELEERFPDGYSIIPSSVHEILVVPKGEIDDGDLDGMICQVNDTEVSPEEVLSDHAYHFGGVREEVAA